MSTEDQVHQIQITGGAYLIIGNRFNPLPDKESVSKTSHNT